MTNNKINKLQNLLRRYERFARTVQLFRRKGGIYRHFLSIPSRLLKHYYSASFQNRIKKIEAADFPKKRRVADKRVIISLTSFPARINWVSNTIKSLLIQKYPIEKIILWLSSEEFTIDTIPQSLKELECELFEIRLVKGNIKSHKKYYYALKEFSDCYVITVDDDHCYSDVLVNNLMRLNEQYPNDVCANVIRIIRTAENNKFAPYKEWTKIAPDKPKESDLFVAIGYGGVLYPPHIMDNMLFDEEKIKEICPFADDLWLKGNEMNMGIKIASGGTHFVHPITISGTQAFALQRINMSKSMKNDEQWENICKFFGIG